MRQLEIGEYERARDFVLAAIIARGMSQVASGAAIFGPTDAAAAVDAGVAAYLTFEGKFNDGQDQQT